MSQSPTGRPERVRVSQACEQCRSKKSKCDGKKPTCSRCAANSLDCQYGFTRGAKNQQMIKDLASKVARYEHMLKRNMPLQQQQTYPDEEVAGHPSFLAQSPTPSSASEMASSLTSVVLPPTRLFDQGSSSYSSFHIGRALESTSSDTQSKFSEESWGRKLILDMSVPPRALLEKATSAFLTGSAVLFNYFDDNEIDALLEDAYSQEPSELHKLAICQLCALAAVGTQYYPNQFDEHTGEAFLALATLNLGTCLEESPLSAMRVMALLCMYFTFEKRNAALVYADMGLRVAKMHRNDTLFHEEQSTPWKRTFFSLVFLECWLCATTGHLPTMQNHELHSATLTIGGNDESMSNVIQFEMVKISVLSSAILQDVYHARFVSTTVLSTYKNRLQQYLLGLPDFMRLDFLLNSDENKQYLRPIFLIHLLYMSTLTLVYRRVLVELACFGHRYVDVEIFQQAENFLDPCLWAARQIAKILELSFSQGQILPKCWMFINSTYCTANVLLYFIANRLLTGETFETLNQDFTAAKICLDILTWSAKYDQTAAIYADNIGTLHRGLVRIHKDASLFASQGDRVNPGADERLAKRLRQLVSMAASFLLHPFDGGLRRDVKTTREALVGSMSWILSNSEDESTPGKQFGTSAYRRRKSSTRGQQDLSKIDPSLLHDMIHSANDQRDTDSMRLDSQSSSDDDNDNVNDDDDADDEEDEPDWAHYYLNDTITIRGYLDGKRPRRGARFLHENNGSDMSSASQSVREGKNPTGRSRLRGKRAATAASTHSNLARRTIRNRGIIFGS